MKKIALLMLLSAFWLTASELNERGYFRAMYVKDKESSATAVGGSIEITPKFGALYTQLAFYTVAPLGAREDSVTNLFAHDKNGYSILGVAAIGYKQDAISALVGRQRVVTPLVDMDDGRIVPNLFEGASIKYAATKNTTIEAYYLTKMSGFWSQIYSGEDMSRFVSMSKATGYGDIVPNAALWSVGATHKTNGLELGGWAYHSPNLINLLYAECKLKTPLNSDTTIELSIQGVKQNANGALQENLNQRDKTLNQHYAAIKAQITHKEATAGIAVTKISDSKGRLDKNMMNVWAGIPQYTVLNEHVMKSFDTDGATMYKTSIGYMFDAATDAKLSYLYVDGLKTDVGITELALSKKIKNFSINGVLLLRSSNPNDNKSIFKSTLEYRF